jgi:hypothetical protein
MIVDFSPLKKLITVSPFIIWGIFIFGFWVSFFSVTDIALRNQFVL